MAGEITSNPNVITGLSSGMDTKSIVEQMIAAERKKVEPVEQRKEAKKLELDAWKQTKVYLENVKAAAEKLSKKALWEGKIVSSSNPEVVEAIATSGAKPGKHTLVVDKLALNHQIASQGFAAKEDQVGQGEVMISIGEDQTHKIVIDETNDNLQGFVDAINALETEVSANIIKTGNKEKPFQVVLTSKKTGRDGEVKVVSYLNGEGEAPTFDPYYLQPGKWKGIGRAEEGERIATGTGASTAIPELIGEYKGDEALDLTFTVVNTGIVGVSENLRMRWEDNTGRYGYLDLGSFSYTPGEPLEVVDGISLILNEGEIIVNDVFKSRAKNQDSELYWWKSDEERAPKIKPPTSWKRQSTEGGPIITGKFESEDDDVFTLKVVGSGQIGQGDDLKIEYESEGGLKGIAHVGKGYEPGTKLSLGKGLELELKQGLLNDGDVATFGYQAESTADYWWLDDSDRREGGQIVDPTNWISPEVDEDEEGFGVPADKKPVGARVSNADKTIVGTYTDFEPKVYTFTSLKSGSIGVTKGLELQWEDDAGNSGILKVGAGDYQVGNPLEFDSGLSLVLGEGSVFETDSFSFRTFTPVIQPPQDAEIRLGATDLGGGLLITNPTNTLEDVIDGVKLNLLSTDEKPVTISIRGDTEKALEGIAEFTEVYNSTLQFFKDVTKYEKDTNEAAPLQGDRNLPRIQREANSIFIDPIIGLEDQKNMLIAIGLKINQEGLINIDEEKLTNAINDNLTTVADLFRSHGRSENTGIVYLGSSEKTQISGKDGFEIDITAAATRGSYSTRQALGPVTIDDSNKDIYVTVNGRESEKITLETGTGKIEDIAKDLQRKMKEDKNLGKMKVVVTSEDGQLTIRSNVTGTKSTVSIRAEDSANVLNHPLLNGNSVDGSDVQGTIDGEAMQGSGQILTGEAGSDYEGLKLYVSLTENQIGPGAEGNMIFTKGVGTKVMEYITQTMEPEKGALDIYTKNIEEQLKNYEEELETLEDRISKKREKLSLKFAKMEGQLGQLKSEQNYLTGQLAKLG
ncbi:MAG: flagellar filament capping protein FliD [Deltaproteobacteria bacterium]|nr:flagellar filament capping protein FliD [Deltaproteobacteria bacterium]MBT4267251.1 flagellar filament capping protein FliD [Deltaproteobacteria bacterium]MBT6504653.1 flagellar filament capping protein FliD [Deltaproteobacteria bacterium]MBT7152012.1 flagellar filament capping protein FliD [Deltaproteobacteria bacterium]MBT7715490.1 flagellar filament capping protein FliD [Deltaproteobacteria bacterium]